jgi:hypothetical protein
LREGIAYLFVRGRRRFFGLLDCRRRRDLDARFRDGYTTVSLESSVS